MKTLLLYIRFVVPLCLPCLLIFFACDDDPAQPPSMQSKDTTSHNFQFTIDTLGIYGNLNDVFLLNDSCAYVVGWIHTKETDTPDSLGEWKTPYNVAKWDGKKWNYLRIEATIMFGKYSVEEILSVYAFAENDVWMISIVGSYIHWDGFNWTSRPIPEHRGLVWDMEGTSKGELYLVGSDGSITYYDGSTFQSIPCSLKVDFRSVSAGSGDKVYISGEKRDGDYGSCYAILENNELKSIYYSIRPYWIKEDSVGGAIYCLWASEDSVFITTHEYVWLSRNPPKPASRYDLFKYSKQFGAPVKMTGTAYNNVFIVGGYFTFWHFNGKSWKLMPFYPTDGDLSDVSAKGKLVFCGGRFRGGPLGGALIVLRGVHQ